MGVESEADRLLFLDPKDFGTVAAYRKGGTAPSVAVSGIFDAEHQLAGLGGDVDISSLAPKFLMRAADLPSGSGDGDVLTIHGSDYAVRHDEPDGTGMVTLRLERL